ncbi:MAG: hypothetical protein SFX74_02900 [Fimbriimonadaceae bacterium]|nr:hypothetical protein [Fimbriimonadaceae bacterium]
MLVIVAIVAIVSALLTVGISEGRKVAFRSTCLQNLYQLGVATKLYTADADGYLPPYGFVRLEDYDADRAAWKRALNKYGAKDGQFFCPADPHARTAFVGNWHDFRDTSYTLALSMTFPAERKSGVFRVSVDTFSRPSEQILYHDQEWKQPGIDGFGVPLMTGHGDVLNAVYLDGHVATQRIPRLARRTD